jgi:hypothetical protein
MAWIRVEDSPDRERLPVRKDGFGFIVGALCASGLLSLVATWFVVKYSPIPDDNDIYIGLIGFFFVVFLDLCFIFQWIADLKPRRGERVPVIMRSMRLLLLGLLLASVLGSIPWLFSRLWSHLVAAMPWLPDALWVFVLISYLPNLIALWKKWRARQASKQTIEGQSHR